MKGMDGQQCFRIKVEGEGRERACYLSFICVLRSFDPGLSNGRVYLVAYFQKFSNRGQGIC